MVKQRHGLRLMWLLVVLIGSAGLLQAKMVKTAKAESRPATTQSTEAPLDVEPGMIPVFRVAGLLKEVPEEVAFSFELEGPPTLHDLLIRIEQAAEDDDVRALVLTFDTPTMGWAQAQELRGVLEDFRDSGKDIYCYLEEADARTYLVACGATKIYMPPTGDLLLIGLHAEQMYFKGLLDKLGLTADMIHIGDYKTAGEPFTRTEPSEPAKEMLDWLLTDLYQQMVENIAVNREISEKRVRALIDRGPFTAEQAFDANLVDEIMYAEQLSSTLRERYGEEVVFDHHYARERGPEVDFSNPFSFFSSIGKMMRKKEHRTRSNIAVVYAQGMIVTGSTQRDIFGESSSMGSTSMRRILDRVRLDDDIKAVVLRIDSPGGSALASDIIWEAAHRLNETKPLVVSMGNVAASGGYYISVGSATIYADPATITGSIGVVGGKLVTKGLWDWAGVNFYSKSYGKNADLFSSHKPFTEQQRETFRNHMTQVYDAFKDRVRMGRQEALSQDLESLAGGRVYTGRQAKAKGLIDELGGLREAIACAAEKAELEDYDLLILPERKNFMEMLFEPPQEDDDEHLGSPAVLQGLSVAKGQDWLSSYLYGLSRLDPLAARSLMGTLQRIELLGKEQTLLVLPGELNVR